MRLFVPPASAHGEGVVRDGGIVDGKLVVVSSSHGVGVRVFIGDPQDQTSHPADEAGGHGHLTC